MNSDGNAISRFFPTEDAPRLEPLRHESTEEDADNRTKMVLGQTLMVQKEDNSDLEDEPASKPDFTYDAFRAVEDLTEAAQYFYTAAGKSLPTIAQDRDTHIIPRTRGWPIIAGDGSRSLHARTEDTRLAKREEKDGIDRYYTRLKKSNMLSLT